MSVSVQPFLMFEGRAEEAMQAYVSIVPGSEILDVQRYGPGGPGKEGTIFRGAILGRGTGGAVHRQLRAPRLLVHAVVLVLRGM